MTVSRSRREGLRLDGAGRRLRSRIARRWLWDSGSDAASSVFLAGTGRSGSTWLSDIINYKNEYRYLFEPFHPGHGVAPAFGPRRYLRPADSAEMFLSPARAILEGRVRGEWVDKYNRRVVSRKRLIKEVRANLFLGWLRAHFPATPIVLLLRHPCAVVASQMALKDWDWSVVLANFSAQPDLMAEHLEPFRSQLERPMSEVEQYAVAWAIDYLVPLRELRPGEAHVLFYEHVVADPAQHIPPLFAFLGEPYQPVVLQGLQRPSAVSRPDSAIVAGGSVLADWSTRLSAEDVRTVLRVVEPFGLDIAYSDRPEPRLDDAAVLLSELGDRRSGSQG
jgi:hypothetical protein